MAITVHKDRASYFNAIFPLALKMVKPTAEFVSFSRTYEGLEGFKLVEGAPEVQALLLLSCLKGISANLANEVLEDLILRALVGCKIDGRPNLTGFLERFQSEIGSHSRIEPKGYRCIFYLQTSNLPAWITTTSILGHRIHRASKASSMAISPLLPDECASVNFEQPSLDHMQLVEVNVNVKRPAVGIDIGDRISQILRGSCLLSMGGKWSVFERTPRANNPFRPSPFYFLRDQKGVAETAFVPHCDVGNFTLPEECPAPTRLVLRALSRTPEAGSVRELIARAVSLYATAGDAQLSHDRFLGLWQTIETLSLAEGGDTRQVSRNVANLWNNGNNVVYYQLTALAPIRNKLVHVGEYGRDRQSATYLLDRIARDAIIQFTQLSTRLKTKDHFREFMAMMSTPESNLKVKEEAIKTVRSIRGF